MMNSMNSMKMYILFEFMLYYRKVIAHMDFAKYFCGDWIDFNFCGCKSDNTVSMDYASEFSDQTEWSREVFL